MKFGQSIEYNFSKNHTQSAVEKIFPDPFLKTEIGHLSGSIL